MGICLGWSQSADIPQQAWDRIRADFQNLADPYQAELSARFAAARERRGFLSGLLLRNPPDPVFQVSLASQEALEVTLGGEPAANAVALVRLERASGEQWARQEHIGYEGVYQGEILMAALLLVERHAPGVVQITQDDYEPGCWAQAAAWMEPAVGGKLNAPIGAGGCEDNEEDDLDDETVDAPGRSRPGPART